MGKDLKLPAPKYLTCVQLQATTEEAPCYLAFHPELPNCLGQGDTPQAAALDLAEATELTLVHLAEKGLPIPEAVYLANGKAMFAPPSPETLGWGNA